MNGYALPRPYAHPVRTWAFAFLFVAAGFLAFAVDILGWPTAPYLWLGLLELALGAVLMSLVFVVARAHNPWALRIGLILLSAFVILFLVDVALIAAPS
jgi:hypothetical protein